MNQAIFELIRANITGGVLNADFSLPEEDPDESSPRFAAGAMDGITLYHMGRSELDAEAAAQMAEAVKSAAAGNIPETDARFFKWTKAHRSISVVDELQRYVIDHKEECDAGTLFSTARALVLTSSHIECVKIGLAFLELFREPAEDLKEAIRLLGSSDEFTVFAVWNMHHWTNGTDEIFALAKKVHGWGRIHAVECLEPATEEIRYWLLTDGTVNDVMDAYSSLTCWEKSRAEEILFGNPTQEEYRGIATLIEGLLDEGPVPGISQLDNANDILLRFLEITPAYDPEADVGDLIQTIQNRSGGQTI